MSRFTRFCWAALTFNLGVILWGAYVRATGSGAGCGSHWPLCNGTILQSDPSRQTWIELTHRVTSGLSLILAAAVFIFSRRSLPRGHSARAGAAAVLGLTLSEALIGALIVLMGWVALDRSVIRGVSVSLHFVNTLLLTGALTWTALESANPRAERKLGLHARLLLVGVLLVGATGAITALGDTLFPAHSLLEGIKADLDAQAPRLLGLRVYHPFLAVAVGVALLVAADRAAERGRSRAASAVRALVLLQILLGFMNLIFLAPIPLQLLHLAVAQGLWVSLVTLVHESSYLRASAALKPAFETAATISAGVDPSL